MSNFRLCQISCNFVPNIAAPYTHPSGIAEPSVADVKLTEVLKTALNTVDVILLDHFIVAGLATPVSLVARGIV